MARFSSMPSFRCGAAGGRDGCHPTGSGNHVAHFLTWRLPSLGVPQPIREGHILALHSARIGIPGKVTPADRMVGLGTPGALSPIMHFIAARKFTTSPDANNSAVSSCAIRRRFV